MERQVERPMDLVQMTRLLLWLDEEHRKDKSEIQLLREKLNTQGPINENHSAQIRELSAQLAILKNQSARMAPLDEALNQSKSQIAQLREQVERYRDEIDRADAVRKTEVEHLLKTRTSLEQRLEELSREVGAPMPRLQALSEDYKRVMGIFPQFEAVRQQATALAARLPVLETEDRRSSDRLGTIERSLEDMKNVQVRIEEQHRLGVEEQRHAVEQATAQAQALQRRFEERTAALQLIAGDRAKDQESLIAVRAQIDAVKQGHQGIDARVARLEEQIVQSGAQLARFSDFTVAVQQEQTRVAHVVSASETRHSEEMPELRKAAADQETLNRDIQGQLADVSVQLQRERDSLVEVRRQMAGLTERHERAVGMLIEFQEQTLREQANALAMRIQDSQRLPRPAPGTD